MQNMFRGEYRFGVQSLWSRARLLLLRQQRREMSHLQEIIQSTQDLQGVRRIDVRSHFGYDLVRCTMCFGKKTRVRYHVWCYRAAAQKLDQNSH